MLVRHLHLADMETHRQTPLWRTAFDVASTAAMISLAAVIVWQGRARLSGSPGAEPAPPKIPIPKEAIPIGDGATRGSLTAEVAMIEYSDFECAFCARFAQDIEPALRRDYIDDGRVLLVVKHFPLAVHENAEAAAQAAWCAGRQSRFWEMHDRLFSFSGRLRGFSPESLGKEIGLDMVSYDSCRNGDESREAVRANRTEGDRLSIPGTPLFFFGKLKPDGSVQVAEVLSGAKSLDVFRAVLDRLLG